MSVVPGGRVEPGESVEETAVRELLEETGLEVKPVRELGVLEQPSWRVPGVRDENHFVHAKVVGLTEDEWIHNRAFHCHWVPLRRETTVYGEHGALLQSVLRKRVVGYVTRGSDLLVFDHVGMPEALTQVPAGRVDPHESLEEGLRREVEEETGVSVTVVGEFAGPEEIARLYDTGGFQENHAFHAVAEPGGPDVWEHAVTGDGMDAAFVYACRWVALADCPPLWGRRDPLVEKLRRSITPS